MRRIPLILVLLLAAIAASSTASISLVTDLKPIVLDPTYRHDRFDTQPKDIVRQFRAYTTCYIFMLLNDNDWYSTPSEAEYEYPIGSYSKSASI